MTRTTALTALLTLALWAGAPAMAQETPSSNGTPPGATTGLPFVNDGANQPVLQPLTPGAAPIEAPVFSGETDAGAAHAAQGGEHAKKAGLPQFNLSTFPRQLFWLTLTFVLLYVVFANKTLPAIGRALESREQRIAGDLAQAEGLKGEVERMKAAYEAAIADARTQAQAQMADIQSDMKRSIEAQDADFKARAENAVSQLETRIEANRGRVTSELNTLAADLAGEITSRVAGLKTDANAARAEIDAQINAGSGNMKAA